MDSFVFLFFMQIFQSRSTGLRNRMSSRRTRQNVGEQGYYVHDTGSCDTDMHTCLHMKSGCIR